MIRSHIPIPKPRFSKKPVSRLKRGGRIKPVSAKRVKINKIYSALRKKFMLEHPICQWWMKENGWIQVENEFYYGISPEPFIGYELHLRWGAPYSEDVHHMKGRGKYLLDVSTWMAVSRKAHDYIHAHPKESEEKGYILRR